MSINVVAKIVGYHGVKGEIKLHPLLDEPKDLQTLEFVFINDTKYKLIKSRFHKNYLMITLEGVVNLNQAETLKGYVSADYQPELKENEILVEDLIGMKVYDPKARLIGKVKSFSDSPQVLIFIEAEKELDCKSQIIVPFVEEYIAKIDKENKRLIITLPEDLIELSR